jgi:cytochrome c oxidase cbb3-type subunit III
MSNSDQSHESHADGIIEAGKKAPIYFYLLFFGLIAWGVVFMAYYLFSDWSSSSEFDEKMAAHQAAYSSSAAEAAPSFEVDAAALFAGNCASCHGEDGSGGLGSNLTSSNAYKHGRDADGIKQSISDGRGEMMPSFSDQFSAAQLDALTKYCLSLQK